MQALRMERLVGDGIPQFQYLSWLQSILQEPMYMAEQPFRKVLQTQEFQIRLLPGNK